MSKKERKPFLDRFSDTKSPLLELFLCLIQLVCAGFFIYATVIFWLKFSGLDGSLIEFSWANGFNVSKGGQLVHAILFTFITFYAVVHVLFYFIDSENKPWWYFDLWDNLDSELFYYPAYFGVLAFILGYIIQYANGWNTFANTWYILMPLSVYGFSIIIQIINEW